MKNKILKILNKPKIVISVTALIALVAGVVVYKTVGISPSVKLADSVVSNGFNDGQGVDLAFPKSGRVNQVLVKEGDVVHKGQALANLDYTDAKGALMVAKANYEKVLNGATGADIDVAKAAVETAQVALDQAKLQQDTLVKNAKKNLLNSGFVAVTNDQLGQLSSQNPPIISGTYLKDAEGQININVYNSSGGTSFTTSGLVETSGMVNTQIPQPLGDTGLYVKFQNVSNDQTKWIINIPNTQSTSYTQNVNAYQSAVATENQVIANATAVLNQAKSALLLKQSAARPEDVAAVSGALEVAQGAYDNDFIYAPTDGIITAVNAAIGETIVANQKAISMVAKIIK